MPSGASDSAARLADAQAHLAAAREPRASGPGADRETLRRAYLDLLKLCLCDLTGPTTASVGAMPDGTVMARELYGDGRRLRSAGMDWPLQGLTMVGLRRLDDLQACVESVVTDGVEGDVIEAGAWRGGASILMRAALDTLGDERAVVVADSFQGFAAGARPDSDVDRLSSFDFLAVPQEEVRDSFARFGCDRNVELVPGFFEETLHALAGRPWAIVRLDADTYEATHEALGRLYPGLVRGGYLIIDDYSWFDGCRRAVDEFRDAHGIEEPLEPVDFTCVRWRRTSERPVAAPPPREATRPRAARAPAGERDPHVATAQEITLARELAGLREHLAAAEAELTRLRRTPWHRLRRRLGARP